MSDEKSFIKQCLENKPGAIAELYKRYGPVLYGICLRYASSKEEAEDWLHDGFVRILKGLNHFRSEGSFEGWLKRIMVNTAINHYHKKQSNMNQVDIDSQAGMVGNEVDLLDQMSANELMTLIQKMPEGYRQVFNLYAMEGFQHKEISEMLGISVSTSKTQFLKARKYLIGKIEANKLPHNFNNSTKQD